MAWRKEVFRSKAIKRWRAKKKVPQGKKRRKKKKEKTQRVHMREGVSGERKRIQIKS